MNFKVIAKGLNARKNFDECLLDEEGFLWSSLTTVVNERWLCYHEQTLCEGCAKYSGDPITRKWIEVLINGSFLTIFVHICSAKFL